MLQHLDSAALYDANTVSASGKYASISNASFQVYRQPGAFTGSYAVQMTLNNSGAYLIKNFSYPAGSTAVVCGWRMKTPSLRQGYQIGWFGPNNNPTGAGDANSVQIRSSNTSTNVTVNVYNSAAALLWTAEIPGVLGANVWNYYEVKLIGNPTVTRVIVRINNVVVADSLGTSLSGIVGTYGYWAVGASAAHGSYDALFSDMYILDDTGTYNNDFLGDTRVEVLTPNGDGANTGMSIVGTGNLVTASQYEATATTGFVADTNVSGLAISSAQFHSGTTSLAVTTSLNPATTTTSAGTSGMPVSGSTVYTASAWVLNNSGGFSFTVGMRWYDSSGAVISTTTPTASIAAQSTWTFYSYTTTSPSNAAYAAWVIISSSNIPHFVDQIGLYPGTNTTTRAPSDTTHYTAVNEVPYDGDGSYVTSSTVGTKDTYAMSDLASTTGQVVAVQAFNMSRKENPTPRTVSNVIRRAATDYAATAKSVNNDLAYHASSDIWETDPATSLPWTIANVNAMEAGVQIAS